MQILLSSGENTSETIVMEAPKDGTTELSTELEKVKLEEKEPSAEHEGENDAPLDDADQNGAELDDDENEQNPAFIPKKGKYYMHDSRDDGPDEAATRRTRADGSWKHDRFDERWQRPKSKKQLVTKYGFDIRRGESQESAEEVEETEQKPVEEQREQREEQPSARGKMAPRARRGGRIARVARVPQERPQPVEKAGKSRSDEQEEDRIEPDADSQERRAPRRRRPNEEVEEEMGADRRQRLPPKMIRNVRGGRGAPRAAFNRTNGQTRERRFDDRERDREPRQDYGRENIRYERRDYREETDQRREERDFENHRRGVMRGAVRGAYSGPPRTFQNNRGDHRGSSDPQPPRNTYNAYPAQRGSYQNGAGYIARGTSYGRGASSRGAFRGNGGTYYRGGQQTNRRLPSDRYQSNNLHGPMSHNAPRPPRQPTDAVYFDPGQQRNAPPPTPRNKNILEIVPPS